MARPGVTYQDVSNAANELKGQSRNITIENIRNVLGTGSIGTINKYLHQWRDTQDSTVKISTQTHIPDELVSVLKGLWDRVVTQSAEQFTTVEEELLNEIAGLKQELEKYKSNNQRWQKLFNQWQHDKTELDKEKLTLEQALSFSHKENSEMTIKHDSLYQQLQEKQERIYELNRLHKQAQENLEHYRQSVRDQRESDQQKFDQEKQRYLLEIKKFNDESSTLKDRVSELHRDHQMLQQLHKTVEATHRQNLSKLEKLSENYKQTEKEKIEFSKDIIHLKEKLEQTLAEIKLLNQELREARVSIKNIDEKNKLLIDEKWMLSQEKAHLEGQLKQIQKSAAIEN